mgnify:CR=1 FL=1
MITFCLHVQYIVQDKTFTEPLTDYLTFVTFTHKDHSLM